MRSLKPIFWSLAAVMVLLASGCGLDWRESYEYNDKNPFDLYVLHQLMDARDGEMTTLQDSLFSLSEQETGTYMFIGNYAYYNERDITYLLDFVERGNTAFIAAEDLPEELAETLYGSDCYYTYDYYDSFGSNTYSPSQSITFYADTVSLTLENSDEPYELVNIYDFKPSVRYFNSIPEHHLCDPEIDNRSIGTVDTTLIAYVRLSWGEGYFYFNTQPKFFTNYYLVDSLDKRYAEDALATVLSDGPIYWDEASRVPPAVARQRRQAQNNSQRESQGRNLLSGNESLSYIQDQPPLALAWYLLIFSVLLYILFRGKRRQRIIPIINPRENSSKRFIDTLSRLIFQKGNHGALARQELRLLKFYLQDRYGIRWKPSEPLPTDFTELTGASPEMIQRANIEIKIVHDKSYLDETALIKFHQAIEPLYQLQASKKPNNGRKAAPNKKK